MYRLFSHNPLWLAHGSLVPVPQIEILQASNFWHPILKPKVRSQKLGSRTVSETCSPQVWHCGRLPACLLIQARTTYVYLHLFCCNLFKLQVVDLDNQLGRFDFWREKVLGQDGQNSRSQSRRRRRRSNKVHKINWGIASHVPLQSHYIVYWFSSKPFVLASDGFGTLQSLACSIECDGFSVEDRSTGRSRQPKEAFPILSLWSWRKNHKVGSLARLLALTTGQNASAVRGNVWHNF